MKKLVMIIKKKQLKLKLMKTVVLHLKNSGQKFSCMVLKLMIFTRVDKQKIFAVHHAAIQEVDRIQQTLQTENTQLKTRETLETQLADVLTRLSALEND